MIAESTSNTLTRISTHADADAENTHTGKPVEGRERRTGAKQKKKKRKHQRLRFANLGAAKLNFQINERTPCDVFEMVSDGFSSTWCVLFLANDNNIRQNDRNERIRFISRVF